MPQWHFITRTRLTWCLPIEVNWDLPNAAIVDPIQTSFMATVCNSNSRAHTSLAISQLAYKGMDAFISSVDQKLGEDNCVGGMLAKQPQNSLFGPWNINWNILLRKWHQLIHTSIGEMQLFPSTTRHRSGIGTFAAPPIQYFCADSQGVSMMNSSLDASNVVVVSMPRT